MEDFSNLGLKNQFVPTEGIEKKVSVDKNPENLINNSGTENIELNFDNKNNLNEYKKGNAPTEITFDMNISNATTKSVLMSKENLTGNEMNILDIISKAEESTFKAILESFDQMLAHSRKMMEENLRFQKEKLIPKMDAQKKEIQKMEIQKEILNGK